MPWRSGMKSSRKDLVFKAVAVVHCALYRWTGGKVGGRLAGCPVLLLTTTGRRSGKQRTTALLYLADGDRLVVVASRGGDDLSPAWYHNLHANPGVTVQTGRNARPMRAATTSEAERERLWP